MDVVRDGSRVEKCVLLEDSDERRWKERREKERMAEEWKRHFARIMLNDRHKTLGGVYAAAIA